MNTRNDNKPCSCGSGKKSKKCCVGKERRKQAESALNASRNPISPERRKELRKKLTGKSALTTAAIMPWLMPYMDI